MPKEISYREHFQNLADGVDDLATEMVETARNFYCSIYQNTPQWVLRKNPFVSPLVRKGLEQMCPGQDPPPPPQPLPFLGGQCCDTTYDVTARVFAVQCLNDIVVLNNINTVRITGKILSAEVGQYPPFPATFAGYIVSEDCNGNLDYHSIGSATFQSTTGNCTTSDNTNPLAGLISIDKSFCEILSITVVAGNDDCGDPPGGYPEIPPPEDDDITQPFNITYNDNSVRTIIYNINRDPSGNIYFPPVINADDVAISFDITNICIGCVGSRNDSGGGGGGGAESLTDEEAPEEETEEEVLEDEEEGGDEEVLRLKAVQVNVTQVPVNNRSQFGNGSPNIIYAGWLEFKIKNGYTSRQRMDFRDNYFIAPEGAIGYAYCLKTGFKANITVIKEKVKNE